MTYQVNTGDIARPVVIVDAATGEPVGGTSATAMQVQGNVAAAATDAGNPVKIGGVASSIAPAPVAAGQRVNGWYTIYGAAATLLTDTSGNIIGRPTADAQAVGFIGTAGLLFNGATWDRLKKPASVKRLLASAATTNADFAKASAGDLFKIVGNNTVASKRYLKLYNKASAPTVGTDTPVMTLVLPASSSFTFTFETPMYFGTGIAFAITGAAADADTTTIGAGDIECLNFAYA